MTFFPPIPGQTDFEVHEIRMGEAKPVRLLPYRIPVAFIESVLEELKSMMSLGIIKPSKSQWAAPLVTVRNNVYYMPRPEELVDVMGHAQFISTLDMTKGFCQVPMTPNDSEKTAFVMSFSLKNSPATFQRLVDNFLEGHRHILRDI